MYDNEKCMEWKIDQSPFSVGMRLAKDTTFRNRGRRCGLELDTCKPEKRRRRKERKKVSVWKGHGVSWPVLLGVYACCVHVMAKGKGRGSP